MCWTRVLAGARTGHHDGGITPQQSAALHDRLRDRLRDRKFDMLFVNAGTTNSDPTQTIGEVTTEQFVRVMLTNALSPARVVESVHAQLAARETSGKRLLVLMTPGWVRTELGGPDARLTIEASIPPLVNVLLGELRRPGLEYFDRLPGAHRAVVMGTR